MVPAEAGEETHGEETDRHSVCILLAAPVHVTAIWLPVPGPSLDETGSIGAGVLLEPLILLTACAQRRRVSGHRVASVRAVEELAGVGVRVEPVKSPMPGRGYAVSAVAALAASMAASMLLRRSSGWALRLAHRAEVLAGTGLGDVAAIVEGRFIELRLAPGAPGVARVEYVVEGDNTVFILAELGEMTTAEMHRLLGERLYREAAPRLRRVFENPSLETLLEEARAFSLALGMLSRRLDEELSRIPGLIGWYVKKKLLVAAVEEEYAGDALEAVEGLEGVEAAALYRLTGTGYMVRLRGSRGATRGTGASW